VIAALRYEWCRLVTLRSTYWLVAASLISAVTLSGLIAWGFSEVDLDTEGQPFVMGIIATQGGAGGVALLIAYVMSLFGVLTFGHEYRHGMIRATLTAVPGRVAVFAAKIVVTALVTGLTALLCTAQGVLVGRLFLRGLDVWNDDVVQVVAGVTIYSALFALVGLALAALFRNQIAALVLVLLVPLVGETIVRLVLVLPDALDPVQGAAAYLPFDAGAQMYVMLHLGDATEFFGYVPPSALAGGVTFAVVTAVLLAVAGALFVRRDA